MGIRSLVSYIKEHKLNRCSERREDGVVMEVHHLLLDMNSVVHSVVQQDPFTAKTVIQGVVAAVRQLISMFPPSETLAIVFDGVAPSAKLVTQKTRRAAGPSVQGGRGDPTSPGLRYNQDYVGQEINFSRAEIISGSEFLLACEDVLRSALGVGGRSYVPASEGGSYSIIFSGCTEAGEGELKVSAVLRSVWLRQRREGRYTGEDKIAVVGNDSDLFLVAVACTPYRRYTLVHPAEYTLTVVDELFEHWRNGLSGCSVTPERLSSYRIDFVFLVLLSGCDWFQGIEKAFSCLWSHYRYLRSQNDHRGKSLIRGENFNIDMGLLRLVMSSEDLRTSSHQNSRTGRKTGAEPPVTQEGVNRGIGLLKGAMWALRSIVIGQCYDYGFCSTGGGEVTVAMLQAACRRKGLESTIRTPPLFPDPCLPPLGQCIAVLGLRGHFSPTIRKALRESPGGGEKLTHSISQRLLVDETSRILSRIDVDKLTPAERELLQVRHMELLEGEDRKTTFMSFKHGH